MRNFAYFAQVGHDHHWIRRRLEYQLVFGLIAARR